MGKRLSAEQYLEHARRQVEAARRLLGAHRPDDTGTCRCCGRLCPCADQIRGRDLLTRFEPVVSAATAQDAASVPPVPASHDHPVPRPVAAQRHTNRINGAAIHPGAPADVGRPQ